MTADDTPLAVLERIRDLENELATQWQLLGREEATPLAAQLQLLEISADGQIFALVVDAVREVVGMMWPHPLPEAPPWLLGTFVFEGHSVPVVDLRIRVSGEERSPAAEDRVVIVDQPSWLGLVVDSVGRVFRASNDQLTTPGATIPHADFLIAELPQSDGSSIHLLSPQRLSRELDV